MALKLLTSAEQRLNWYCTVLTLSCSILVLLLLIQSPLHIVWVGVIVSSVFILLSALQLRVLSHCRRIITRANWQLEAIAQSDFTQTMKPHYKTGVVAEFEQRLLALSTQLHTQKRRYHSQQFIIYQLIDSLNTPILMFDDNLKLAYANGAFSSLYHRPWQECKGVNVTQFGLMQQDGHWQFRDPTKQSRWQLHRSEFFQEGKQFSLLVALDITKALRQQELAAWQHLIRVISHEIHNSLTPVSSLAQTLLAKAQNDRDKQALSVIGQRCQHLRQFVGQYAKVTQTPELTREPISVKMLLSSVAALFESTDIEVNCTVSSLQLDKALIEQVLINLVKNAIEACTTEAQLTLKAYYQQQQAVIEVLDNGPGFANLDNILTPFYSTKAAGQGIGLTFSRNIVELHDGQLVCENTETGGQVKMIFSI
ncbi:ATP-binding protein [Pseudoalteromonas sp. PS5]|uniref:sensor histidine kinase n=1 Tax=Pseudoalteromonas sp. PS5 TaxID=1437473 RepID=UPI000FFEB55C|nr:ATP-binding protein [Pseudoalteromonas sp. PS5]RXF02100.1 GHKL domain-containing protein [Pseudoalteromonas sp. PS5]